MKFLRLVSAILLPPLAVFLTTGISTGLIVSVLLTALGWVPGIIHALWLIQKTEERQREQVY
ncbi:YqaE/Pmp3 family membrane protein [Myxacorys almedinensis]|uniref:YqaE/Pmp3 family membrane protein n=1 Tax=Myxacorys almedinensis A TaxID=2690445 RepID=A0A8J8CLB0_9CYAN|nr:YqaE/Pmp3 family membrane protein [Myxacorys almedinensis]NDJ17570.1 YqaE/Pmp3 family membrane protein [Myxacorys almedinensis A]